MMVILIPFVLVLIGFGVGIMGMTLWWMFKSALLSVVKIVQWRPERRVVLVAQTNPPVIRSQEGIQSQKQNSLLKNILKN